MSGTDKFGSVFDRMNMKLESKFLNYLRIKTQLLKQLQRVIVVDCSTQSQKDGVEGNRGSLKDSLKGFLLFLQGAQLVLRPSVLTVHGINEVDVTLRKLRSLGRCCLE